MHTIAAIVAIASVTQGPAAITLNVVIAANGSISIDGRPAKDEAEVEARAKDAVRKSPDARAVIAADKAVPYGKVIAVMDALKRGAASTAPEKR